MSAILDLLRRLISKRSEEGQSMVEYALVLALIAVGELFAMAGLGTALSGVFTRIADSL